MIKVKVQKGFVAMEDPEQPGENCVQHAGWKASGMKYADVKC